MALDDANVREEAASIYGGDPATPPVDILRPSLLMQGQGGCSCSHLVLLLLSCKLLASWDDLVSSDVLGWLFSYLNNGEYIVLECTLKILRHLSEVSEEYSWAITERCFVSQRYTMDQCL